MNEKQLQSFIELRIYLSYLLDKEDLFVVKTFKRGDKYNINLCERYKQIVGEPVNSINVESPEEKLDELKRENIVEAFADSFLEVATQPDYLPEISRSKMFLLELYHNVKEKAPDINNEVIAEAINNAITRISDVIAGTKKYTMKDIIDQVTEFVESKRMCFAFIKALMCSDKLPMDDFETAVKKIDEMYEGKYKYKLDAHDLAVKMNTESFRYHPSKWDINKAPVKGKRFSKYLNIANMTLELAKKLP